MKLSESVRLPLLTLACVILFKVYHIRRLCDRYMWSRCIVLILLASIMDRIEALNAYLAATGQPTFDFFGPDANCTLEHCSPNWSVYGYRPTLGVNIAFLAVFFAALLIHVYIGLRWRAWSFMGCMISGCLDEMLGYGARIWMFYDLWNFNAFMIQVGKRNSSSS